MIHTATQLVKFKKLQRRLGLTKRREVIGLLESLWHLTLREAPKGDIGKLDNETIAIELEWDVDPDQLVNALVETRWLDADDQNRLVVHDWQQHAPNFVKGNLASHKKAFAGCSEQVAKAGCSEQVAQSRLPPNQTKPDITKPDQTGLGAGSGVSMKRTGRDWGRSVFRNLKANHLRECEALADWFRYATTEADSPLFATSGGNSESNLLLVFGAAERAVEQGDDPLKLFKHIVGKGKWDLITQSQEDRARKRIAKLKRESAE